MVPSNVNSYVTHKNILEGLMIHEGFRHSMVDVWRCHFADLLLLDGQSYTWNATVLHKVRTSHSFHICVCTKTQTLTQLLRVQCATHGMCYFGIELCVK